MGVNVENPCMQLTVCQLLMRNSVSHELFSNETPNETPGKRGDVRFL